MRFKLEPKGAACCIAASDLVATCRIHIGLIRVSLNKAATAPEFSSNLFGRAEPRAKCSPRKEYSQQHNAIKNLKRMWYEPFDVWSL